MSELNLDEIKDRLITERDNLLNKLKEILANLNKKLELAKKQKEEELARKLEEEKRRMTSYI